METKNHTLSQYPKETAGRIMTRDIPVVDEQAIIGDVEKLLEKRSTDFKSVSYIYVVNKKNRLKGIFSVKEIFRAPKSMSVKSFILKELVTVRSHTDQERVALLALQHNLKAVPVVDSDNHFLGVVTSDTILGVLHSESIEDVLRFAGAGKIDNPALQLIKAGVWKHFRWRFPWLFLGLLGGAAAAFIVSFFERSLTTNIALAAFIPAIVYMADAVGTQTQTIFIRSLALEHSINIKKYVFRECQVNILLAILLGGAMVVFSFIWPGAGVLSIILGVSIFVTVLVAMVAAIVLPWLFQKFHYDPAIASGPFATVIRDIMSLVIYFSIASLLL